MTKNTKSTQTEAVKSILTKSPMTCKAIAQKAFAIDKGYGFVRTILSQLVEEGFAVQDGDGYCAVAKSKGINTKEKIVNKSTKSATPSVKDLMAMIANLQAQLAAKPKTKAMPSANSIKAKTGKVSKATSSDKAVAKPNTTKAPKATGKSFRESVVALLTNATESKPITLDAMAALNTKMTGASDKSARQNVAWYIAKSRKGERGLPLLNIVRGENGYYVQSKKSRKAA